LSNFFGKSLTVAFAVTTGIFTFVPESVFGECEWIEQELLTKSQWFSALSAEDINVIISRLLCFVLVWLGTCMVFAIFLGLRQWTTIMGNNYSIRVEYGDILQKRNCKRVINFDECFTDQVGSAIADINPTSICGQYLLAHPDLNMQQLIDASNAKPARSKSKYQSKPRYDSGTIVPNGDDLLMAFAKLDERGKGRFFTRDEYLECLDLLWREIEYYYSEKNVCIPVLGAGTTSFEGGEGAAISQQELLDMMIMSYKLSSHKIKAPHKLRIICRQNRGFSINRITK
jgi:hypothetical protein